MFLKDSPELNGIINSGHTRPTAFVIRTVGEDFEPRKFSTWGAKAIASIGGQSTTLHDRSIIIELRRKLPGESAEKLRHADRRGFERITQRIVRFAKDNQDRFGAHRPNIPDVSRSAPCLRSRAREQSSPPCGQGEAKPWSNTTEEARLSTRCGRP